MRERLVIEAADVDASDWYVAVSVIVLMVSVCPSGSISISFKIDTVWTGSVTVLVAGACCLLWKWWC